jgi:hypothetical protein
MGMNSGNKQGAAGFAPPQAQGFPQMPPMMGMPPQMMQQPRMPMQAAPMPSFPQGSGGMAARLPGLLRRMR